MVDVRRLARVVVAASAGKPVKREPSRIAVRTKRAEVTQQEVMQGHDREPALPVLSAPERLRRETKEFGHARTRGVPRKPAGEKAKTQRTNASDEHRPHRPVLERIEKVGEHAHVPRLRMRPEIRHLDEVAVHARRSGSERVENPLQEPWL